MASAYIVTRATKSGERRYFVRFRTRGRASSVGHAGVFKTEREARERVRFVGGELAAGRNPAVALGALSAAPASIVSLDTWGERFVASRIDVAENTRKMYRSHLRKIGETFGDRDPHSITAADVAEWVAAQAEERKPGTVAQYLDCFKLCWTSSASSRTRPAIRR